MPQESRVCTDLPDDPSSVPRTHAEQFTIASNSRSKTMQILFWIWSIHMTYGYNTTVPLFNVLAVIAHASKQTTGNRHEDQGLEASLGYIFLKSQV